MEIGIYQIRNLFNGKIYIGSAARTFDFRWKLHIKELKKNNHRNSYLQNAWNKYGEDNFVFEILERCEDKDLLLEREQCWMDKMQCYSRKIGYNICKIAGSSLGVKRSEEYKQKAKRSAKKRFLGEGLENHPNAVLNWNLVRQIRKEFDSGKRQIDLCKKYDIKRALMWKIVHKKAWKESN